MALAPKDVFYIGGRYRTTELGDLAIYSETTVFVKRIR